MPEWHDAEGRVYLPPKQKKHGAKDSTVTLKDLLGRSPDRADALRMANWARIAGRKVIPHVTRPLVYSDEDFVEPQGKATAPKPEGGQPESLADRLFGPEPTWLERILRDWPD